MPLTPLLLALLVPRPPARLRLTQDADAKAGIDPASRDKTLAVIEGHEATQAALKAAKAADLIALVEKATKDVEKCRARMTNIAAEESGLRKELENTTRQLGSLDQLVQVGRQKLAAAAARLNYQAEKVDEMKRRAIGNDLRERIDECKRLRDFAETDRARLAGNADRALRDYLLKQSGGPSFASDDWPGQAEFVSREQVRLRDTDLVRRKEVAAEAKRLALPEMSFQLLARP